MVYEYVTDNNLDNKQNYMYSTFGGVEFLNSYFNCRQEFIKNCSKGNIICDTEPASCETEEQLTALLQMMRENSLTEESKTLLDKFTKGFEVRKRIYDSYDWNTWKPSIGSDYNFLNNYLLLDEILVLAYSETKCLKYLNTLLKIDDTLLSVKEKLSDTQEILLFNILIKECQFVEEIINFRQGE